LYSIRQINNKKKSAFNDDKQRFLLTGELTRADNIGERPWPSKADPLLQFPANLSGRDASYQRANQLLGQVQNHVERGHCHETTTALWRLS